MKLMTSLSRDVMRSLRILFILLAIHSQCRWSVNGSLRAAREKERCQKVGYKLKLVFPSCYDTVVDINTCIGACISATGPFDRNELTEVTTCCRVVEYQEIHVRITCRYNKFFHTLRSATKCSCGRC